MAPITLNRPEVLNAVTPALTRDWAAAIRRANEGNAIGANLVDGTGKDFCAGVDLEDGFLPFVRGGKAYVEADQRLGGLGEVFDWIQLKGGSKPLMGSIPFLRTAVSIRKACFHEDLGGLDLVVLWPTFDQVLSLLETQGRFTAPDSSAPHGRDR